MGLISKRLRILAFALLVLCDGVTVANAGTWEAQEGEEDWGTACFLTAQIDGGKVGFYGAPGQSVVGFVERENGGYPKSPVASWQIDDGKALLLNGGLSDYFGHLEFDADRHLLEQISHGKILKISSIWPEAIVVDLTGSMKAFQKFKKCLES